MVAAMVPLLRERNWQVTLYRVTSKTSMDFTRELKSFQLISRVLLFISHAQPFRQLMIQAKLLGLCTGEYVYIGFTVYKTKSLGDPAIWQYGDENDTLAREAYRSAMIVSPDVSVYALPCWTSIKNLSTGYVTALNLSFPALDPPIPQLSSVMESFLILGQVLEETLRENDSYRSFGGRELAEKLLNRRFDLGFAEVALDEFGQRLIQEELFDMDPATGKFKPALQLQFTRPKTVLKLGEIDWGGPVNSSNAVPLNEPICGYHGNRGPCAGGLSLLSSTEVAALTTVLSAASLCLCAAFYYYHRYRYPRRLGSKVRVEKKI
ncbi:hypothetical protein RvY_16394-2 [Ramazzottius varieornatus]|uniref:Receptor ligand binding region domain-containing protein n=1 Tax=Ramazzottius varieornatus TaxID=947166 RepID=A0A1D1VY96_RAMVA|nr:hypothetical protein RvY_16394-2 [Ramazzottius varieornatus]